MTYVHTPFFASVTHATSEDNWPEIEKVKKFILQANEEFDEKKEKHRQAHFERMSGMCKRWLEREGFRLVDGGLQASHTPITLFTLPLFGDVQTCRFVQVTFVEWFVTDAHLDSLRSGGKNK